jgi:hypothetical protein
MSSDDSPGPGWTKGLDGQWYQDDEPVSQELGAAPREVRSASTNPSPPSGPVGEAAPVRFFAVATIMAALVLVGAFGSLGVFFLIQPTSTRIGILLTAMAMGFALVASKAPYMATAGPDGSVVFRALRRSKQTNISRISRISFSSGSRGASSWVFAFDGTTARLSGRGGRVLARYVIERNPLVDYPRHRFPS